MDILTNVISSVMMGLEFLKKKIDPSFGFQTDSSGLTRDCLDVMEEGRYPLSIFTNILALDLLGDVLPATMKRTIRKFIRPDEAYSVDGNDGGLVFSGTINYGKHRQDVWPDDADDSALYNYVYHRDNLLQNNNRSLLDFSRLLVLNVEKSGLMRVYFDPMDEPRTILYDACVISNSLRFLYYFGTDTKLFTKSEDYIYDWLVTKKYLEGSRYYHSPDIFLYFCAEAVSKNIRALQRFHLPLKQELKDRTDYLLKQPQGKRYPIDYASNILAMASLDLLRSDEFYGPAEKVMKLLVEMQCEGKDGKGIGGWPADSLYKFAKKPVYLGGQAVSTIFAVAALSRFCQVFECEE